MVSSKNVFVLLLSWLILFYIFKFEIIDSFSDTTCIINEYEVSQKNSEDIIFKISFTDSKYNITENQSYVISNFMDYIKIENKIHLNMKIPCGKYRNNLLINLPFKYEVSNLSNFIKYFNYRLLIMTFLLIISIINAGLLTGLAFSQ
jgi:uncharacterized protein (DUF3820 family)